MKRQLAVLFLAALAATPVLAQKVDIDYAHEYDFGSIKTFQYVNTEDSNAQNPMMADRIEAMIKKELTEGGLTEVDTNPDIMVTYHVTTADQKSYTTSSFGYGGYGGGWGGWGYPYGYGPSMATATTTERTYTEGTLIIDAYDAAEKKMIWRGTGTVTVKDNPQKRIKQVEKIFNKLGKKWDKILAGKGK